MRKFKEDKSKQKINDRVTPEYRKWRKKRNKVAAKSRFINRQK